jgi:hypothetical protein
MLRTPPASRHAPFDTPVDRAMLRRIVRGISSVGSHPLGFRAAGTPEEHEVADLVAAEMRAIGLEQVHFEHVPVHAWRFRDATVDVDGLRRPIAGSSMAGVQATPRRGITGELVFVGDGRRDRLDRLDVRGKIALVDWKRAGPWISETGLELGLRGAKAIVVCCLENGSRFLGEGALGTSVGHWHEGAPPLVTVRQNDGRRLIERCSRTTPRAHVTLDVEISRRARGRNVCGVLGADRPGAPVVVGAHHDGWFFGAFDNASGVATMLTIARGLVQSGWQPRRPVWFVSHTAEEYGRMNDDQPWCVGGWHQVAVAHPEWGGTVPFYLDIEASGRAEFPQVILSPPELRRFVRGWGRRAAAAGLMPSGWKIEPPSTGTHQWPFQLAGVPGLSVLNWHPSFERTDYHTDNDTMRRMDFGYLSGQAAFYAAMLVDAEARGETAMDYRARERDIARAPGGGALAEAAAAYAESGSRRAFARVARRGIAVDAAGEVGYVHEQAAKDAKLLADAVAALDGGDVTRAAKLCEKVGMNGLQRWVSPEVQARAERRHVATRGSWPEKSHLTRTPDLWHELASMRGERGAKPYGPWVRRSLERQRARMEAESRRRMRILARALRGPASG